MAMHQNFTLISPRSVEFNKRLHFLVDFELDDATTSFKRLPFEVVVIEIGLVEIFRARELALNVNNPVYY